MVLQVLGQDALMGVSLQAPSCNLDAYVCICIFVCAHMHAPHMHGVFVCVLCFRIIFSACLSEHGSGRLLISD